MVCCLKLFTVVHCNYYLCTRMYDSGNKCRIYVAFFVGNVHTPVCCAVCVLLGTGVARMFCLNL